MRALQLAVLALILGVATTATARPARIVLVPVVVHSSNPEPGYVSRGLSDMLSARLEQLDVVVVRPDTAEAATARLSKARDLARTLGGDYVLFGSFTQFGDGASLDIQCAPVEGGGEDARRIFIQSGTMGEIIPKLDELADKVGRYVGGERDVASEAPAAAAAGSTEVRELRRRLEALERAVFPPVAEAAQEKPTAEDGAPES